MKSTTRNPLCVILYCLLLHTVFTVTAGNVHGPDLIEVVVLEGNDAILPCSLNTKENLVAKVFDWKKDGPKNQEVFLYDAGVHYNNGRPGQDEQFRGRVAHFQQELHVGNASIIITNTKVADSGNYTCFFPNREPEQTFKVELLVAAAPKPDITILDVTQSGVQLSCVIESAFPQPTLQWEDSDGNVLPAEETEVSERGGRYNVTLCATVTLTKTNCFYCVVKQEDFHHVNNRKITLPKSLFKERCRTVTFEWLVAGIFLGALILAAVEALFVATKKLTIHFGKGCQMKTNFLTGTSEDGGQNRQNALI